MGIDLLLLDRLLDDLMDYLAPRAEVDAAWAADGREPIAAMTVSALEAKGLIERIQAVREQLTL